MVVYEHQTGIVDKRVATYGPEAIANLAEMRRHWPHLRKLKT